MFSLLVSLVPGSVCAAGLSELSSHPALGERLHLELNILGADQASLGAHCFRLVTPPNAAGIPWIKSAHLTVRQGTPPVLEIRSQQVIAEPIMAFAVQVSCGQEFVREYMILASPPKEKVAEQPLVLPASPASTVPSASLVPAVQGRSAHSDSGPAPVRRHRPARDAAASVDSAATPRLAPSRSVRPVRHAADRLSLSAGESSAEPRLRFALDMALPTPSPQATDVQRERLRLEFRMLMALQAQALDQLEANAKIKALDQALQEVQKQPVERSTLPPAPVTPLATASPEAGTAVPPAASAPAASPVVPPPSVPAAPAVAPVTAASPVVMPKAEEASGWAAWLPEDWPLYGGLVAVFALLASGLVLRDRQARRKLLESREALIPFSVSDDTPDLSAHEEVSGVDSSRAIEPHLDSPRLVPQPLETVEPVVAAVEPSPEPEMPEEAPPPPVFADLEFDSPAVAATVDTPQTAQIAKPAVVEENREASPVMELADIMLSFGRVKGAAQALKEYVDANPKEALQPWIRLLDVYRMAGMKEEFETLAQSLNQNFNVEIQHWETSTVQAAAEPDNNTIEFMLEDIVVDAAPVPVAKGPSTLEDMPRILQQVIEHWHGDDFVVFAEGLLRDNRGGARQGFSLTVVEDLLFLIDLKKSLLAAQ